MEWLNQTDQKNNIDLRDLVYRRHKLTVPKCGCYGKKIYMKVKNRVVIKDLEEQIDEIIGA